MSDLVVDYDLLESSKSDLASIKQVFDSLESAVSDASHCWGDDNVSSAMHTFATNWGYHRAKLSDLIQSGCEKIEKTLTSFKDADRHNAQALTHSVSVHRK
ncbi:hypothetical protein [Oryzihumus leptocrescens]|uniref:Uncharacterized protein n=1 Tax=Oryzihumus leptocrescens TaxID=297536 RepID=A0A542ZNJ6_9MICO|nr:hypothetical protein [Oryzihumus leptocrescens]TQL61923.1 hypothetical protein FB474_3347 [Oryzihumus leptocrescens]